MSADSIDDIRAQLAEYDELQERLGPAWIEPQWLGSCRALLAHIASVEAERDEAFCEGIPAHTWRAMWNGLRMKIEELRGERDAAIARTEKAEQDAALSRQFADNEKTITHGARLRAEAAECDRDKAREGMRQKCGENVSLRERAMGAEQERDDLRAEVDRLTKSLAEVRHAPSFGACEDCDRFERRIVALESRIRDLVSDRREARASLAALREAAGAAEEALVAADIFVPDTAASSRIRSALTALRALLAEKGAT